MRILANSIPKSGTHLLLRLLTLLEFDVADLGGIRPSPASNGGDASADRFLRSLLGTRKPEQFLGIGPHLLEGGRFPPVRRFLRTRGSGTVTIGVDAPKEIGRRWLERRLRKVPDGSVVSAHCTYTPELAELVGEQKMRTVCIIRDPRDTAVSHMHYLKQLSQHVVHREYMALPGDRERLLVSIRGGKLGRHTLQSLDERYRRFLGWEREGGAAMVKFEELVGPRGGGSAGAQRRAIERIVNHLELEVSEQNIRSIQENLFGSGRTFRKGRAGGWREEFSGEHRQAVKEVAGELLVELGYESGTDW